MEKLRVNLNIFALTTEILQVSSSVLNMLSSTPVIVEKSNLTEIDRYDFYNLRWLRSFWRAASYKDHMLTRGGIAA